MRKLTYVVGALLVLLGGINLNVYAGGGKEAPKTRELRLPHCCAEGSHFDVLAKKFSEAFEKKTNGAFKVKVFPGGQLGQETEVIQNVQEGTIELTVIGHDPLAQFAPITTLLSLPYLFKDHDHAFRVLEGPVGKEIEKVLLEKKLRVLGWGNNGARVYTNNRGPIEKPDDLRGLKIRSPQNPVNLAITEAMGGIGAAIPYGEVYTALQQKTIDGQENSVINIYPAKLYEVQKFMSMTHHLLSFVVLIVNDGFYNSLSDTQKKAIQESAQEAVTFQRKFVVDLTADLVEKMKQQGVSVNYPEMEPFRKATQKIHEQYINKYFSKELYDIVVNTK
jgi:tripartite ATP-independent transporter DctP family solute receptor